MNLRTFTYNLICLLGLSSISYAQNIKLKDITKIELVSSGPWWAYTGMKWVEVLPEGKEWNCYHLRSQLPPKLLRDSTRRLIKTIPVKDLERLLAYINNPDTTLKFEQFDVSTEELKKYIDTLQTAAKESFQFHHNKEDSLMINLTAEQKAYFLKIIKSKQAVKEAGLKAFHPFIDDDRSYYGMIFTYKDKHKDTVSAYVNSYHLYQLPWKIKNKHSYNAHLTELFESIIGHEGFDKGEKSRLVYRIDYELFRRWVITKISWDDYKLRHSSNYQSLSKTLSPVMGMIRFKSASLPFNIQLQYRYPSTDTLKTSIYNDCEKEIVSLYKRGGFFFDYMKAHPTTIAFVESSTPKLIEQAKFVYPNISKFESCEIKYVYTAADFYQGYDLTRSSRWLLLPDGTMILLSCSNQLIQDGDKIFAGFPPTDDKSKWYFCIVYDKEGHKIASGKSADRAESK
ncbi:hypothetical protein [Mucilaginibacter panaciglaebae]|uniref:Uncharacterized protein n=1 Tax=Mucilaginibacter panaciglaebae TaxID=502331 RepID=A0ABP7WMJ8_9SPHI